MSDSAAREWRFYLDDMIGFAEKAIAYTDGLDQVGYVASGLNYGATVRNLELIGEAATHIAEAKRKLDAQVAGQVAAQLKTERSRFIEEEIEGLDLLALSHQGGMNAN